jgi:ATP-dependent protease Clp ATPase subunit
VEEIMLPIMFDVPDRNDINHCIVDRDVVDSGKEPHFEQKSPSNSEKEQLRKAE